MAIRKIRTYDKEFKLNAVSLYESKGISVKQISDDLGIPLGTLVGWLKAFRKEKKDAFPGKGYARASEAEFVQLRKELSIVKEERDILKKALGIFSSVRA